MQTPILTVTLNPAFDLATSIDRVRPDVKLRCTAPSADPGGGGINVSRAIARLKGDSRAAVSLGGPTGARMAELLAEEGIATVPLPAPGETRLSLAVTETLTGSQFRFMLPGPDWAPADAEAAVAAVAREAGAGLVVLSGSTPPGVAADIGARLARALPPRRLIVDTSGAALACIAEARAGLAVLRMDGEEAEGLAGRPLPSRADSAAFAAELVAAGAAEVVMVARGGDGNILASAEGIWHAEALRVHVVSKVGAGDSFVAGYTLARARGEDQPGSLGWAAACATAACMTPATDLCALEDVERLHAAGSVTRMA